MRISKVTTKTGDRGQTSLGRGEKVSKSHPRIQCLGGVDELNAQVGFAIVACNDTFTIAELKSIQNDLFNLGGEIATPNLEKSLLPEQRVGFLEQRIEAMNEELPPLKEFILPGGDEFSARLHIARTVCRRVERDIVGFPSEETDIHQTVWLRYLNRLSDYFFVLARYHNSQQGVKENMWEQTS
ncbi:MAG: cob(I)yrinic acid a,c-diamide adenosyltransferase [FCB group bacterium]|nr:cob(I)yrinic acid a,c-diamide adenosyltransferase [FCB group bacterium]